ncbi:uncharacterized protein LOC131854420 [Achroia grisella]|uniref:uncharacterized protein LOC131854420 n=1 Tax=Achroia grisella TaxID=688607 RepID=UPI0027D34B46|nr:uncharacterized protein LOC131854420 [Achroia grisella]
MNFYRYFCIIISFVTLYIQAKDDINIMNYGLDVVSPFSIGLQFFVNVNNTSDNDIEAELIPDECCLKMEPNLNCDILEAIGDCIQNIPKGSTKMFKMVAPLLDPFERYGYCVFNLDSVPEDRHKGVKRIAVKIPFDTRLKNKEQTMEIPEIIKLCSKIDEDPLNNCKPVDCDIYYNGRRSYFNKRLSRCSHIPKCISEFGNNISSVIYNPNSNKCVREQVITNTDIHLLKNNNKGINRKTKDIILIQNVHTTRKAQKHKFDENEKDFIVETILPSNRTMEVKAKSDVTKNVSYFKWSLNKYSPTNKFTLVVLSLVIIVQCCIICTMMYCLSKNCPCCDKKKVVRKFFNYKHDASVTTPLIATSNIDTDTTEFQYLSESSNIDKKIKCYKACQKEWKNNIKMSMSDDILSKCVNRRDWNRKPGKSNAIPETDETVVTKDTEIKCDVINFQKNEFASNIFKTSDVKVNFENELQSNESEKDISSSKRAKSIVKKIEDKSKDKKDKIEYPKSQCKNTSEREIKCHSYNNMDDIPNITGFQTSTHSNNVGVYKYNKSKKGTLSASTEKGAQAVFSNDSIDDFLSGRGMFLTGENLSKYSFFSGSNIYNKKTSTSSDISSKTSKNNLVRNVLSLLRIKSKHGHSSDPGKKKSSQNFDIEILHDMSHASIYSSSNNDSDYIKHLKITKESRSSM